MKVDLTVLNKLVKELNDMVSEMDKKENSDHIELVVELAKATGLATGVSYEATALVNDFLKLININSVPLAKGEVGADMLMNSLLGIKPKN